MRSALGVAFGLTLLGLLLFLNRADLFEVRHALRQAPLGLAISLLVHAPQLLLTALAWWFLLPAGARPSVTAMLALRWIRESLNSLAPAGAIVGQTVAARHLARTGVAAELSAATATTDITIEAGTQALITLTGVVLLLASYGDRHLGWLGAVGLALAMAVTTAMVGAQRHLPVARVEAALVWLAPRWAAGAAGRLAGLQDSILRLHADRLTLARAALCHLAAWALGAVEVSGILWLLGHPLPLTDGFIVESLAQALRAVAFMIPGGLGVQEGAIVAACGLVGVPPSLALMLALLRRTRELVLGVPGLLAVRAWRPERSARRADQTNSSSPALPATAPRMVSTLSASSSRWKR